MPALLVRDGINEDDPRDYHLFVLEGKDNYQIGRQESCDIILDDPQVAEVHLAVYLSADESWRVKLLSQEHKVFVNRKEVEGKRLRNGDKMEFGESFVQFFESTYLPKGSGGSRGSGSSRLEDEEELSPLGDELLNHPHFKTPGIYLTHGGILGEYIHIQGRILLGRSSQCTLVFRDVDVSRTHASLEVEEDGVLIRDLASRNGVFVNEQRCDELKLQGFDLVRLGNTEFIFIETEENLEMLRRLVRRGSVLLRKISTLSGEVGGAAMEVEAQGEEKQKSIAEVFKKDKEEVIQEGEKENE